MGLIFREQTAPIVDGEKQIAADVENELAKIFTEQDPALAGLDAANFARSANIVGTQFANTTIAAGKFQDDTLQTSRFAASAVPKAAFAVDSFSGALTSSATLVDLTGMTATLTPGSTNDIVVMSLAVSFGPLVGAYHQYQWGFNIDDGTGDVLVGVTETPGSVTDSQMTQVFQYGMTATAAAATVYKAVYKKTAGTTEAQWNTGVDYNCVFTVQITPIK